MEDIEGGGKSFSFPVFCEDKARLFRHKALALWAGDVDLSESFWLYGFAPLFALKVLSFALGPFLGTLFSAVAVVWAVFMVKPVLMAAARYEGDQSLALAAKIAVIVLALTVLADFVAF